VFQTSNLGRFGLLLLSLTLTFITVPFLSDEADGISEISILYTVVMVVGAYAVSQNRRIFLTGLVLALPAVASEWISNFHVTTHLVLANMMLASVFFVYVSGVVIYEVLAAR